MQARITRRQILTTSAGGALLGASWAAGFESASSSDDLPSVAVIRNPTSLAALIQYERARILVLDADAVDAIRFLTETVTGFTKQRIDILIASSAGIEALPAGFIDRWQISRLYELPGEGDKYGLSSANMKFSIGALEVTAADHPSAEWKAGGPDAPISWFVDVSYQFTRIVLASDLITGANHIDGYATTAACLITNDAERVAPALQAQAEVLALPAEADALADLAHEGQLLVPLYRERPASFLLTTSAIEVSRNL